MQGEPKSRNGSDMKRHALSIVPPNQHLIIVSNHTLLYITKCNLAHRTRYGDTLI